MNNEEQRLLAIVLDRFAQDFGKNAILRGGMVLQILGSSRYTNDLDYVFVPYTSKNQIVDQILKSLSRLKEVSFRHSLNSKCLRVVLTSERAEIQVEAKVAKEVKTDVATTKLLAEKFNLPKRVIHIVDHSVSLANKLAAWNERRLMRDLYDIWFFLSMNVKPDSAELQKRLKKPVYSRSVKESDYFQGTDLNDFYNFLREQLSLITEDQLSAQLSDYLVPDEMVGLLSQFRAAFVKLYHHNEV